MKTTKKAFPQLSSTNSFNTSNSKNRLGQLSSNKNNYFFQTPSTSKRGNTTTSTKKDEISTGLNSPIISISSSKRGIASRIANKEIITKLYYTNSSSKKVIQNNKKEKRNKLERKKSDFLIDREKEVIKFFLKKHNTDLKNIMTKNNKKIHNILNGKNINQTNNFSNRIIEINEFKQFIQKNQFDKDLLKTFKKKSSFH